MWLNRLKSRALWLNFRGLLVVGGLCVVALVGFAAIGSGTATPKNANAQVVSTTTPSHLINITGQATYFVKADMAYISTDILVRGQNASDAIISATNSLNALTSKLKGDGLTDADIQASNVNLYPTYIQSPVTGAPVPTTTKSANPPTNPTATPVAVPINPACASNAPNCSQVISGYNAEILVTVRVNDLSKLSTVITDSSVNGTRLIGVRYTAKDSSAQRNAAVTQAIQNTRSEADAVAAGLGVKISGVANVTVNTPIQTGVVSPVSSGSVNSDTNIVTVNVSYTYS